MPYVYAHTIGETIVYIGKGTADRAQNMYHRNSTHRFLQNLFGRDVIKTHILKYFKKDDTALEIEDRLIRQYQPLANNAAGLVLGGKKADYKRFLMGEKGLNDSDSFYYELISKLAWWEIWVGTVPPSIGNELWKDYDRKKVKFPPFDYALSLKLDTTIRTIK